MSQRPANKPASSPAEESLDERIAGFMRVATAPAILVAAAVAGYIQGPQMAVLVLAAGALFATVAMFWTSLRALFGETRLTGADAFAIGAPSTEEEQKRAVLRAIKDIEFERSIGKLSEDDYLMLSGRYRAEAKVLLRTLDNRAQPAREHAERIAKAHLLAEGLVTENDASWQLDGERLGREEAQADSNPFADEPTDARRGGAKAKVPAAGGNPYIAAPADEDDNEDDEAADGDEDDEAADGDEDDDIEDDDGDEGEDDADGEADDEDEDDGDEAQQTAERSCPKCATLNDADAVFCKKCGTRIIAKEASE